LLYNKHNYHVDHIWNNDEIGIQASRQTKARVLAKHSSQQVYKTIPKSKERFIMNCGANIVKGFLPAFYIFKGGKLQQDYIKDCKPSTLYGNAKEGSDDSLFVQRISKLFQKVSS
jgi:hypothetical protein